MYNQDYFKNYREQQFRWNFWKEFLKKNKKPGSRVLCVGCAFGYLLKAVENDYKTFGIDISSYAINQARQITKKSKLKVMDAENIKGFKNNFFDAIFCLDVLEHLKNPAKCLMKCFDILKKDGILVISVPNTNSLLKPLKGKDWFAYKDKTHKSLYQPKKWKQVIKLAGFKVEKEFTDGFFDIPYLPFVPTKLQKLFLLPGWLQYKFKKPLIFKGGENLIFIAKKGIR